VTDRRAGVAVLERLLDSLFDSHVSLGINYSSGSPRLVPSGTDMAIDYRQGKFIIVGVRRGGSAARKGIRAGDRLVSLDGLSPGEAARARIQGANPRITARQLKWAINAAAAGYSGISRTIKYSRAGMVREVTLDDPTPRAEGRLVTLRMLQGHIGYIRIEDSLGNADTVAAFDKALAVLKSARAWVLDLRNTPSGGNTDVAEPVMGRFIAAAQPYQRVIPTGEKAYDRIVPPRGPWTADGPLAVLVGRWTGSMGEGMAIGFDGMSRARVIGSAMAGLAGGTESFVLPGTGIPVRFPTYDLAHIDGTPRHRWLPPLPVQADPGDSSDPALAAATEWILKQR